MFERCSPLGRDPPHGGVLAVALKRQAVHHEEADVAGHRLRNVALRNEVSLARDRLEDLVQVRVAAGADLEHVLAARALQWLQDHPARLLVDEGADFLDALRDQAGRADGRGKPLEVELVLGEGEAIRVVQHQHAAGDRQPAEHRAGARRPGPLGSVLRGIAPQHQYVDLADIDGLDHGLVALQRLVQGLDLLVARSRQRPGSDQQAVIGTEHEVAGVR